MPEEKSAQESETANASAYDKEKPDFDAKEAEVQTVNTDVLPEDPDIADAEVLTPGDELKPGDGKAEEGN